MLLDWGDLKCLTAVGNIALFNFINNFIRLDRFDCHIFGVAYLNASHFIIIFVYFICCNLYLMQKINAQIICLFSKVCIYAIIITFNIMFYARAEFTYSYNPSVILSVMEAFSLRFGSSFKSPLDYLINKVGYL